MLTLIDDTPRKKKAQRQLVSELKGALRHEGTRNIGFPGGNFDYPVYSAGAGKLWVAFGGLLTDAKVPRFWNAFGIFAPEHPRQTIAVEINIPVGSNSRRVSGFFAEDPATGDVLLMHDGGVGGGRPGIGKSAFLVSSKATLTPVAEGNGVVRGAIAVARLGAPDFVDRIWNFVEAADDFKAKAERGVLSTPEFRRRVEEFERYNREFSGTKRGSRGGDFEYVTYHGDIVQKLFDDRSDRAAHDEIVCNSSLIDLFVKKGGVLSEVYEVKTGAGRQLLYTAIGQLMTHGLDMGDRSVRRFLVVPDDEEIPDDIDLATATLGIKVRRFKLRNIGRKRVVELV